MRLDDVKRGRFPHSSWAWPTGGLDQLIMAALTPDEDLGLAYARTWIGENDIDEASFGEHRLLMAIAARYGHALDDLPEYPRLAGLRRMLWTKARIAMNEALPPLRAITEQGRQIMLLKGAARTAISSQEQTSRVSHDTDIVLAPKDFAAGLDCLIRHGWTPSTGESELCLAARGPHTTSLNLYFGHFGDVDIHQWGYGLQAPIDELEKDLWRRAERRTFVGLPVLVPAPEDRLALSIRSSALENHIHSDWLVDCARTLGESPLEGARFKRLVEVLNIGLQTKVAFGYLADRVGLTIDPELRREAQSGYLGQTSILLQMKPRANWTPTTKMLRGIAKTARIAGMRRSAGRSIGNGAIRGKWSRLNGRDVGIGDLETVAYFEPEASVGKKGCTNFRLELAVWLDGTRRRLEFEMNSSNTHIIRLRSRNIFGRKGWHRLTFDGPIPPVSEMSGLHIEARPGRALRGPDEAETRRYAAVPFVLLSHRTESKP